MYRHVHVDRRVRRLRHGLRHCVTVKSFNRKESLFRIHIYINLYCVEVGFLAPDDGLISVLKFVVGEAQSAIAKERFNLLGRVAGLQSGTEFDLNGM